jgi:signal transduction histidine kinase
LFALEVAMPAQAQLAPQPSLLGWLVFLMMVTFVYPVSGQTLRSANLQVGQESWTATDGAPPDIEALAQTDDGFLWASAASGLFKFDGTRFEPFRSPFGDRLLSTRIYSMFASPSGGLWVGYTFGGFSFVDNGRVTNYAIESGSVHSFAQDRSGIVWAGTTTGLWRFDQSSWQPVARGWNVAAGVVRQVRFDSQGILWALVGTTGAPKDLIYLMPGSRQFKTARKNVSAEQFLWNSDQSVVTEPAASPTSDPVQDSDARLLAYPVVTENIQFIDRNNSIWAALEDKPGVMRLPGERLHDAFNKVSASGETYHITPNEKAALVDREGNIWLGDPNGIHRFFYTPLIRQEFPVAAVEGAAGFAVAADDNGAVWISFNSGNYTKATLYHVLSGKSERHLLPLTYLVAYRASDKTFWFSGEGCLWHLVGHDFVRVDLPPEMSNQFNFLQSITADQRGGTWVSFGRHGLYRLADGIWTPYGGRDGLKGTLLFEFTDSLGRVWFGYINNQLVVLDGDQVRRFGPSDGLQLGNIQAIYGRGSKIWIGGDFGLTQFDQGHFHNIAAVNDEFLHGISGIVETREGDLWINGITGIFHIGKVEISEALKDPRYRVRGDHIGTREGLPGVADEVRPLQTAVEGTDGRLWFALRDGVVWLDPAAYSERHPVPPPVTIQSVSADDKSYAPASHLSLPAHTSSVQISYSAVSLSDPESIRFRYQLQEADKGWHEVAGSSPVTYRSLPPGSYHFNVGASDINGVWSDKIATAQFTIPPAFVQTVWFLALCVAAGALAVWALVRLRVRQVAAKVRGRMEAQLTERERIARELHDTLMQSTQGLILTFQGFAGRLAKIDPMRPEMEGALDQADELLNEARDRVIQLRTTPPDGDLAVAMERVGQEIFSGSTTRLSVKSEGRSKPLQPSTADEVRLIIREALQNVRRHAGAQGVELTITYERSELRIRVRDDGRGISAEDMEPTLRSTHFGIKGMRERALRIDARLDIRNVPTGGTEVDLRVPTTSASPRQTATVAHH